MFMHRITVIYLPRTIGTLNASLTVETSVGGFLIPLSGTAVANQYRLHPFVGATVPIGVPYTPPIRVTNPTGHVLNVKEVFTTESFLHLTLPEKEDHQYGDGTNTVLDGIDALHADLEQLMSGGISSSKDVDEDDVDEDGSGDGVLSEKEEEEESETLRQKMLWTVPSMATKEIIRLSFTSHRPGTYKVKKNHLHCIYIIYEPS
jgi:hypothetical protein